jgi:competence protein ComEA
VDVVVTGLAHICGKETPISAGVVARMDNMRMPSIGRGRALVYLAAIAAALVLGGRFLLGSDSVESAAGPAESLSALEIEEAAATESPAQDLVLVHVAGAVRRPGLYELQAGSRVDDAIRAAGGPKPRAVLALVNLAAPVADGQQIVVPGPGGSGTAAGEGPATSAGSAPPPVRLNSATVDELDTLPGVGPVTAQRIVDYRDEHGAFASIDDLDAVPGIGPTRLEQLRELLVL